MDLPYKIEQGKLSEALSQKNAVAACLSCGSNDWILVPEAALITQWTGKSSAPGIPVTVAICGNCGFVRMHALSRLGLLPKDTELIKETEDGQN